MRTVGLHSMSGREKKRKDGVTGRIKKNMFFPNINYGEIYNSDVL